MSSLPLPPRGEGTRPSASPRLHPVVVSLSLLGLLAAPACYEGHEPGQPWVPSDSAADDDDDGGDDDDDGDDGGGETGDDGGDGNSGMQDGDDGPAEDDAGDDSAMDDSAMDDSAMDDSAMDDSAMDDGPMDDGMDDGEPPPADVPDIPYCDDVAAWDAGWSQLEVDILELTNMYRAQGANCGSEGSFGPADPLVMQPNLRCSSRVHSKDMDVRNFFAHTNPSGESPFDRMNLAGYSYSTAGENIAAGSSDAAGTMNQWMGSDGHCANIMNPNFTELGVGYHPGGMYGTLWTQNFGA